MDQSDSPHKELCTVEDYTAMMNISDRHASFNDPIVPADPHTDSEVCLLSLKKKQHKLPIADLRTQFTWRSLNL